MFYNDVTRVPYEDPSESIMSLHYKLHSTVSPSGFCVGSNLVCDLSWDPATWPRPYCTDVPYQDSREVWRVCESPDVITCLTPLRAISS